MKITREQGVHPILIPEFATGFSRLISIAEALIQIKSFQIAVPQARMSENIDYLTEEYAKTEAALVRLRAECVVDQST